MTPTVRRRRRGRTPDDDATTTTIVKPTVEMPETPDTAVESPSREEEDEVEADALPPKPSQSSQPPSPPISMAALYQLLDTQLRVNMGAAVRCGICLSTLSPPIARTPCGHTYCRDCIVACCVHTSTSTNTTKCPECQTPFSKRSLQPSNDFLVLLARQYKTTLQDFGWTPSTYQADFTTLTQKPMGGRSSTSSHDDEDDNDDDVDETDRVIDRLHVAATWQHQALVPTGTTPSPPPRGECPTTKKTTTTTTNKNRSILHMTPLQRQENQAVVQANIRACEAMGYKVVVARRASTTTTTPPSQQFPNTQDVLDTAREQQVADDQLDDTENDNDDDDDVDAPVERSSQQQHKTRRTPEEPSVETTNDNTGEETSRHAVPAPDGLHGSPVMTTTTDSQQERRRVSFFMHQQQESGKDNPETTRTTEHNHQDPSFLIGHTPEDSSPLFFTPQESSSLRSLDLSPIPRGTSSRSPPSCQDSLREDSTTMDDTKGTRIAHNEEPAPNEVAIAPSHPTTTQVDRDPAATTKTTVVTTTNNKNNANANANNTGIVEDSFGAIHWVNQNNNSSIKRIGETMSLSYSVDEDTDLSLSLTATYDDPSLDYKQKRAASEVGENAGDTVATTALGDNTPVASPKYDFNKTNRSLPPKNLGEELEDDSQETKMMCGASRLESNGGVQHDDSDATGHISSSGEMASQGDDESNDDDCKPSVRETFQHSLAAEVPMGQETTLNDDRAMPGEVPTSQPNRKRAQSVPNRGTTVHCHSSLSVGDVVNVQSRTWSGINKPGGVARITKQNEDGSYHVAYVLGGRETNVDAAFISKSDDSGRGKRRDTIDHAALPAALLRALKAQGFDTTGTLTLEKAKEAAASDLPRGKKPKVESGISNQTLDGTNAGSTKTSESSMSMKGKTPCAQVALVGHRKRKSGGEIVTLDSGKKHQTSKPSCRPKKPKAISAASDTSTPTKKSKPSVITSECGGMHHELSNEEACVLADARYKSQFEDALKKKVLHVVTSGLSRRDNESLISLSSRKLNGNGTCEQTVKGCGVCRNNRSYMSRHGI